jgi:hypothetical protein
MSLLEVLLAGVLFFGSSTASLLIWSRALATLAADGQRAERVEILEAELQSLESRLRDPALLGSAALSCEQRLQQLVQALEGVPPQPGVGRQILKGAASLPLQVQVEAGGMKRQRSYDPAAFGGCSLPPPSPPTPVPVGFSPFAAPPAPDQAAAEGEPHGLL